MICILDGLMSGIKLLHRKYLDWSEGKKVDSSFESFFKYVHALDNSFDYPNAAFWRNAKESAISFLKQIDLHQLRQHIDANLALERMQWRPTVDEAVKEISNDISRMPRAERTAVLSSFAYTTCEFLSGPGKVAKKKLEELIKCSYEKYPNENPKDKVEEAEEWVYRHYPNENFLSKIELVIRYLSK